MLIASHLLMKIKSWGKFNNQSENDYLANIGVSGRLHDVCKRLSLELSIERFGNAPDMSLRLPLHP